MTYKEISKAAKDFAQKYRKKVDIPPIPGGEKLRKYKNILFEKYESVAKDVYEYIQEIKESGDTSTVERNFKPEKNGLIPGITEDSFCYEHMEWVALLAAYLVDHEEDIRDKDEVLDVVLLTGLLHDIDRHLGWDEAHAIEGAKTAKKILEDNNINQEYIDVVCKAVRYHDDPEFEPSRDEELLFFAYGAIFDADKFRFGLEREDTFWDMKNNKGVTSEEVIHDYKFLFPLVGAWNTTLGKKLGKIYLDFGIAIAKHIEEKFSKED